MAQNRCKVGRKELLVGRAIAIVEVKRDTQPSAELASVRAIHPPPMVRFLLSAVFLRAGLVHSHRWEWLAAIFPGR
jgi:hypothetical protein